MSDKNKAATEKKSVLKKETYTLKNPVSIDGKQLLPGDKVKLTEDGAKDFKRKHRI
jgi:hypothetical protein